MIDARLKSGTITLPLTTTIPYRILTLKDIYGATGLSTTTIQTTAPDVFEDGTSTRILNTAYQSLTVYAGQPGKWMLTATSLSNATTIGTLNISTLNVSTSANFISGVQFTSTVQGLGTAGYISTQQLLSTSAGLVNPMQLVSTVQGLGSAGYASTSYVGAALSSFSTNLSRGFFTSTFATSSINANTGFISSLTVNALYIGSNIGFTNLGDVIGTSVSTLVLYTGESYATNSFTSTLNTSSLVSFSNTMRIVSSQQLNVSSINGFIPWQPSYLTSTVAGLGSAGYISTTQLLSTSAGLVNPLQLTSTVAGLGQAGYVSSTQLLSTSLGLVIYINSFIDPPELASTVTGLGSAGYVSSTQLLSTSLGLQNFINSFIDPTELTSTVIGLGTGGFVSTLGLTYSLASTVTGLGTLGYVSTSQLLSTTVGTYQAITAATNVITGTNLTSTVTGLGSAGYISTTQLLSTSAGLTVIAASGLTQTQVTSSINNLLVPYSTLNTATYFQMKASTSQLYFGGYGSTAQVYVGDVLAANGNKVNTSPLLLMESLSIAASGATSQTFNYTGADQSFIVPTGVTSMSVTLSGAGGGAAFGVDTARGRGGLVSGTLAVTPGESLTMVVGGGGIWSSTARAPATYGGGGDASGYSGGGGGRSAIRRSAADIVTAGGGGGGGDISGIVGGAGGGTTGGTGDSRGSGSGQYGIANGGGGGTQSAGGAGGVGGYYSGTDGSLSTGGSGQWAGGGGGGYYGGGTGSFSLSSSRSAGGGGSSYVTNLTGTVVNTQGGGAIPGLTASNGSITITYTPGPSARPGNILEIRNYQMNKFIVDPLLNVGINVSSITSGFQFDVNGAARVVSMSTQQVNVSSINGTFAWQQNFLQSTVIGLGTAGYVSTASLAGLISTANLAGLVSTNYLTTQLVSTVQGLGTAGYVSTANLLGLVSTANLAGLVSTTYLATQLASTLQGLGSAGYVSTTQLLSTSLGLKLYIDSFIDPTELTSTVIGLGTGGFVSTLGLTYSLASTVTGLGTLGYVSTSQLLSTTVGTYQAITAATNVITGTNLTSTVAGLGSAGYVSTSQLFSTSASLAGLVASGLTQTQVTSSINNLLVPYSTLNTASYFQMKASTTQLYFGGYGSTAQVYMGDVLAANGNLTTTTPLLLVEQLVVPMPSYSNVFTYSSASNVYFTPPAGVTSINVVLVGAGGGGSGYNNGGAGGLVSGTLAVTPGVQITLLIGQGGGGVPYVLGNNPGSISSTWGGGGSGGYGGYGSSGCGAGGGRSAIILGGVDVVAVGGGGGASSASAGGAGGGTSGGSSSYNPGSGASGNTPGTGTNNGSLGTGGNGSVSAGGGGGGWYGGGSGTATAGAGGGGNANVSNLTGTVVNTQGGGASGGANGNYANNSAGSGGNGSITITYSSVNAYRPGNIVEIRNYLTNKFIVDPNLNVGINVSSITTGIQLDVNGTTRSINVSTQQVSVSSINGFIPYQPSYLTSTVQGLGTAGYVSSTQLLSTSLGLITYINSFIDPTELTSTVIGLGTGGFVSTLGLTYSLASTVTGLGTLGYVSTSQLLSTTVGTYQAITAAANVITGTNLTSTVAGLGAAGYISSTQLFSTTAGIAVASLAQTQSSINNLLVPYSTLNTASYFQVRASTSQLFFGGYGSTAQIYMGDVLAANGNTVTTNPFLLMESLPIPVPSVSQTFTYTGSDQQFTVPAGITSLTVTLSGAAGACGFNGGGAGGSGGFVSGTLPVTPGQLLYLVVGAGGTYNSGASYGGGGSGGGSTGAGGGRSAIRSVASSSSGVADTVTAGGGGGGGSANGGAGGGGTTNSGASGTNNAGDSSTGGGGGTTGAGGTAGSPGGTAGSLNTGGGGGRGGGGGYYGGGSGGATVYGSGGGGGSAYTANLTGTVTGSQGGGGGGGYYPATPGTNGYITIVYTPTPGVRPGNILEIRNYLANKFIIDPSLNVGINVSSINTSFALDVNGASRTQSVSTQQIVTSSLGVGIAKPYRRLEVLSSMRVYDGTFQTPTIEFIRNTTQGQAFGASANADWVIAVSTGTYPNMNMYTSYTGTTTNNMTLDYTGKVGINCNTPQYQLDINGISRSCLLLSNLSGTSVTLANSNFGTYFYITNSGFSNIALTGTPSPAAGWYVSLRNNTTSYLSCTLSGQVSSTPASPLVIPPANSVTIAYDNSTSLYVLL